MGRNDTERERGGAGRRRLRGLAWCLAGALLCLAATRAGGADIAPASPLVINEFAYHPAEELGPDEELEFVEIHNRGDAEVDLGGWELRDGGAENRFVFPAATRLAPGGFLVAARDAAALRRRHPALETVLGDVPFALSNGGDVVRLFAAGGALADEVLYSDDPPWSPAADGGGATLERIDAATARTDFTNFAASEAPEGTPGRRNSRAGEIPARHAIVINEILYNPVQALDDDPLRHCPDEEFVELLHRGEAPVDVSGWRFAQGIAFRFPPGTVIAAGEAVVLAADPVVLRAKYGEGATAARVFGPWEGELANGGEALLLLDEADRSVDYVDYDDSIPWPIRPDGLAGSLELVDPVSDNERGQAWRQSAHFLGTPGAKNTASESFELAGENAGPQITELEHQRVAAGEAGDSSFVRSIDRVRVAARAQDADGVEAVRLEYQVVAPGDYVCRVDERYATDWTAIAMERDAAADRWVAELPPQPHRTLVRYRVVALDERGLASEAPFRDDPEPNLAYFVYDGVSDYVASRSSRFGPAGYVHRGLDKLPVYFFLMRARDFNEVQTTALEPRNGYHWWLTFVHEGHVYDHVRVRLRGSETSRYGNPKRNWKVKFNKGNRFRGRFNDGTPYPSGRSKINLMRGSTVRGDGGLLQATAWRAYREAGVLAATTTYVHLRAVRTREEAAGQFDGDFLGLYLEVQEIDKTALEDLDRPTDEAASLYKFQGAPRKRHTDCDPTTVDVTAFLAGASTGDRQWFEENLDVRRYLRFRTVTEIADNHDMDSMKNLFLYFNTDSERWEIAPWDLDNALGGRASGDETLRGNVLPRFPIEYENEFRLVWQTVFARERIFEFIDTSSALLREMADADLDRWDRAGYARFEQRARDLKTFILTSLAVNARVVDDEAIPLTPHNETPLAGSFPGPSPLLRSSAFVDPDGDAHAATRWLLIEPGGNWLEPTWSRVSAGDLRETLVPDDGTLTPGRSYLFRVAHQDATGRWSFLSVPTPFTVGVADASPPAPPARLTLERVAARVVTIAWSGAGDPETGVQGFWVYRDGVRLAGPLVVGSRYSDFGVEPGASYEYQVRAVNHAGLESELSAPLAVRVERGGRGGWSAPAGGWEYLFDARPGDDRYAEPVVGRGLGLLDGSWQRSSLDEWDGGRPGDGGAPGGVGVALLPTGGEDGGPVSVLALEDPGDPAPEFRSPNNRRLLFVRAAGPGDRVAAEGVTLTARWRLTPDPVDLPAAGALEPPPSPFRGQLGLGWSSDASRGHVSFWYDREGLASNVAPTVALDPTRFHSLWMTLAPAEDGAYRLRVYLDGSVEPAIDTAGDPPRSGIESGYDGSYLELGLSGRAETGAIQIDYVGFRAGVHAPIASAGGERFRRGDVDGDGQVTAADAVEVVRLLHGPVDAAGFCADAADVDDSGRVNIADAVALLRWLFGGAGAPAAPYPGCGADPTGDMLPPCAAALCDDGPPR